MARIAVAEVAKRSSSAVAAALVVSAGCFFVPISLLAARRCTGAFVQPLPLGVLIATALVALCAAWLVRIVWLINWPDHPTVRWLPSALLVLLAITLWLPGTTPTAAGALTLMVAVDCILAIALDGARARPFPQWLAERRSRQPTNWRAAVLITDASVVQSWTRRHLASGEDAIEATLRAEFLPGQRTEHCHLAICPAMHATPVVNCQQLGGPAARIKVAQVLPHGARIELKLAEAARSPTQIFLRVTAHGRPLHQPRTQA